jgi:uncharacterized Fe-S cluster-containing radical SAM superfamily protein
MTSDSPPQADAYLDGGSMDCGSGLLLLITRSLRTVPLDGILLLRTQERSVVDDLPAWARLAGHSLQDVRPDDGAGAWHVTIRRGGPRAPAVGGSVTASQTGYSGGTEVPLGQRLWLYTNFDCNLACDYCCAKSSPAAEKRRLPVDLAAAAMAEFAVLGGREVLLTGGEPFLHPELDAMAAAVPSGLSVTILTNAMVLGRGRRLAMLQALDRDRVVLQVSLDSADEVLHDRHRGAGSHARTLSGIGAVRERGFRVRVAATVRDSTPRATAGLHDRLDDLGIPIADRLIRPVAAQGFAENGVVVTLDDLAPEPTLTVDGAWWHPVAVTDPAMRVADHPLPLSEVLGIMRDTVAVQDQARAEGRRHVFRCT